MNKDYATDMPSPYLRGFADVFEFNRENVTRWTVAGVVTMAALLGAKMLMGKPKKKR